MALHLATTIDIDATPEDVWAVLSDLPSYPSWNPFIREASGQLAAGERLDVTMQPDGGRAMRFRPTVLEAEPAAASCAGCAPPGRRTGGRVESARCRPSSR